MRENGIRARHERRFKATTASKYSPPATENVLGHRFASDASNRTCIGGIIYIVTAEGWLYLAVVIDLFSREVIGWSIEPRGRLLGDPAMNPGVLVELVDSA